ncbi:MAG: hypothetical protein WBG17_05195 [Burkholderiaceae bacterium]
MSIDAIYRTDEYPREGCTVVIKIEKGAYSWSVFHPSAAIVPDRAPMESYFPRPIGSLGTMLDGWARRLPLQEILRRRGQAERAYAAESESGSMTTL